VAGCSIDKKIAPPRRPGLSGGNWSVGQLPSRPGEFHPEPLTEPDLTLSRHPARATARRLPPSVENWSSSCCQLARSQPRAGPRPSVPASMMQDIFPGFVWSEWQDLNLRRPRPERGALPARRLSPMGGLKAAASLSSGNAADLRLHFRRGYRHWLRLWRRRGNAAMRGITSRNLVDNSAKVPPFPSLPLAPKLCCRS
jgi:hypothetical protein